MSKTNRKPARRTFSTEQTCYMLARAQFETIDAAFASQTVALTYEPGMSEEACEAVDDAREAVRESLNWYEAKRTLILAERVMVKWSVAQSVKLATAAQRVEIEGLADRAFLVPSAWAKMVDLAARLAA